MKNILLAIIVLLILLASITVYNYDSNENETQIEKISPDAKDDKVELLVKETQIEKNTPDEKDAKDELLNTELISDIKKEYSIIQNNLGNYKLTEKDVFGESTEGGVVKYYLDNEDIVKIRTQFYGEMWQSTSEYYYKDNDLFFTFTQDYSYNRPIYYGEASAQENNDSEVFDFDKSIINENRYYFHNNKLIKYIDENNDEVKIGNELFLEKESYLLNKSNELVKDL